MSSFKVVKGSCVEQNVDAIVNAANKFMNHGGGVARAILLKAGPKELNDACREFNLPIKDGENIVTPAFNITNAKIIIHAVGPDFGVTPNAFKELFNAYYNSLVSLMNEGYHSISFPLISSSIFGGNLENPVGESTKECLRAYNKFISDYPEYNIDVLLCAYNDSEYMKVYEEINKKNK